MTKVSEPAANPTDKVAIILNDREQTHGNFEDHARVTQLFKGTLDHEIGLRRARKQPELSMMQRESIEMILHKIGRIIAGNPNFQDHWDDIAGYARIANKL